MLPYAVFSKRDQASCEESVLARRRLLKAHPGINRVFDSDKFRETFVHLTLNLHFRMLEVRAPSRHAHWGHIWPTSVALSQWLLLHSKNFLAPNAIEIGCGLGLVGLTLAHLGILVECTDREPKALLLAEEAAEFNAVPGMTTGYLDWSEPSQPSTDLLIGADVLYEKNSASMLFKMTHTASFLRPRGTLILAAPTRRHDFLGTLVTSLRNVGYSHATEDFSVDWEGSSETIAIHTLQRSNE